MSEPSKPRHRTSNKRGARKGLRRSKTIALRKLSKDERAELEQIMEEVD